MGGFFVTISMANAQTSPQGITPFIKSVRQGEDRHLVLYACIAALTNESIVDIKQQAFHTPPAAAFVWFVAVCALSVGHFMQTDRSQSVLNESLIIILKYFLVYNN